MPERLDITLPADRVRLDAVERLAEVADGAGLTVIQSTVAAAANCACGWSSSPRPACRSAIGDRGPRGNRSTSAADSTGRAGTA
ncbi:hypothetical protein ACGFX8_21480 [Streptomyces sp. NPDC048362]|uniref:hypothetical protein n=1 Tax=Streptomyces sp. NPDC048362 TaxID=3365539 RepID=UPI00371C21AA